MKLSSHQIVAFTLLSNLPWTDVISPDFKCPYQSHRPIRANSVCFPFLYTCLFDTNQNAFIELCNTSADFTTLGEYFVYTGNLRNVDCGKGRYQPFSLWSNVSSQCMYKKSACSDEGQAIHDNRTTAEDRSCICDYSKGYNFVLKPRHVRFCIPSEEDCSCFSVECPSKHFLNSDYQCILNTIQKNNLTSPKFVNSRKEDKEIIDVDVVTELKKDRIYGADTFLIVVVIAILGFGIVFYVVTMLCSSNTDLCSSNTGSVIKVVASIDLGTTYSGYASSTVRSFEKDPTDIRVNPSWFSGYRNLYSMKTPTCVLLKKKRVHFEFIAIGYNAQNVYANLSIDGESNEYFFVDKFKMILYNNENISDDMVICDIKGRTVPASIVFTHTLKELMKPVIKQHCGIYSDEIQWVVTVPAIWSNKAKEFLRRCAEKAGINDHRLLIALESEVVSVYFQYLLSSQKTLTVSQRKEGIEQMHLDTKYLVIDIGGGTVDITAHEKLPNGDLTELCKPAGDYIGGTMVDKEFLEVFTSIIGQTLLDEFCTHFPDSYNDFIRELEKFKENIFLATRNSVYFPIPCNSLNTVCKKHTGKQFLDLVRESEYKTAILVTDDKISLVVPFFINLFTTVVTKIIKNIENVLKELEPAEIKTFLVVGGFSQSKYVQSKLEKSFPNVNIIIPQDPEDANLAVVKGAVLYGHRPNFITSQKRCETYEV